MTMIKHLVPLFLVGIHRDITATPQTQVPEHEIPVLRSVHGDGNVYPGEPTEAMTLLDPANEYDRLVRKYGPDAVHDAYGTNTAKGDIRRAVLAASAGTEEVKTAGVQLEGPDSPVLRQSVPAKDVVRPAGDTDTPSLQWSKAQLLAHATKHGIPSDPAASKPAILAAIEAASVPA